MALLMGFTCWAKEELYLYNAAVAIDPLLPAQ
jgi:hypothetical protein